MDKDVEVKEPSSAEERAEANSLRLGAALLRMRGKGHGDAADLLEGLHDAFTRRRSAYLPRVPFAVGAGGPHPAPNSDRHDRDGSERPSGFFVYDGDGDGAPASNDAASTIVEHASIVSLLLELAGTGGTGGAADAARSAFAHLAATQPAADLRADDDDDGGLGPPSTNRTCARPRRRARRGRATGSDSPPRRSSRRRRRCPSRRRVPRVPRASPQTLGRGRTTRRLIWRRCPARSRLRPASGRSRSGLGPGPGSRIRSRSRRGRIGRSLARGLEAGAGARRGARAPAVGRGRHAGPGGRAEDDVDVDGDDWTSKLDRCRRGRGC